MADINAWLSQGNEAISVTSRAVDAWNRIQRNPTSVTIVRGQTTLSAQTVRVELDNATSSRAEIRGDGGGNSAQRACVVFGVKDHPTATDTNIQRGDRFALNGQQYRVSQVLSAPGEVQATCEALT